MDQNEALKGATSTELLGVNEKPENIKSIDILLQAKREYDSAHAAWEAAKLEAEKMNGKVPSEPTMSPEAKKGKAIIDKESKLTDRLNGTFGLGAKEDSGKVANEILIEIKKDKAAPYIAAEVLKVFEKHTLSDVYLNLEVQVLGVVPEAKYFLGDYASETVKKIVDENKNIGKDQVALEGVDNMCEALLEEKAGVLTDAEKKELNTVVSERKGFRRFQEENSKRIGSISGLSPVDLSSEGISKLIKEDLEIDVDSQLVEDTIKKIIEAKNRVDIYKFKDSKSGYVWDYPQVLVSISREMIGENKSKMWGYAMGMMEANAKSLGDLVGPSGFLPGKEREYMERSAAIAKGLTSFFDNELDGHLISFVGGYRRKSDSEGRVADDKRGERILVNGIVSDKISTIYHEMRNNASFNAITGSDHDRYQNYLDIQDGTKARQEAKLQEVEERLRAKAAQEVESREVERLKAIVNQVENYRNRIDEPIIKLFNAQVGLDWKRNITNNNSVIEHMNQIGYAKSFGDEVTRFAVLMVDELKRLIALQGEDSLVEQGVDSPKFLAKIFGGKEKLNNQLIFNKEKIKAQIDALAGEPFSLAVEAKLKALKILQARAEAVAK